MNRLSVRVLLALGIATTLSACVVEQHPGRVYPPRHAHYEYNDHSNDRDVYKRCPPGHRKKHWC